MQQELILKSNLAILKAEVDKNLKTVPADLSKLSNVVNNDTVKKTVYDKSVTKVNNIDASGFILKTKYNTDKSDLEKKISDADKKVQIQMDLFKTLDYSAKISEIESKTPTFSGLVTNAALTAVENKIPDVSNLIRL